MGLATIRKSSVARFHQGGAFQPSLEARAPTSTLLKYRPRILHTSLMESDQQIRFASVLTRVKTFSVFRNCNM